MSAINNILNCLLLEICFAMTQVKNYENVYQSKEKEHGFLIQNFKSVPGRLCCVDIFNQKYGIKNITFDKINQGSVIESTRQRNEVDYLGASREYSKTMPHSHNSRRKRRAIKNYRGKRGKNAKKHDQGYYDFNIFYDSDDYFDDSDSSYDKKPATKKKEFIANTKNKVKDYENEVLGVIEKPYTENKPTYIRETYSDSYEKDLDNEDNVPKSSFESFLQSVYDPVQNLINTVFRERADQISNTENIYRTNVEKAQDSIEEPTLMYSWFPTWFGFASHRKVLNTTKTHVNKDKSDQDNLNWYNSWFGVAEEKDNYDKWFSSWFGSASDHNTNTTTTSPMDLYQLPLSQTNLDSLIGILSNHMVNSNLSTPTKSNKVKKGQEALSYDKYQIWRLRPGTPAQVRVLDKYKQNDYNKKLNWLRGPSLRGCTDILISPTMFESVQTFLKYEAIPYEVILFDVGKVIRYEKTRDLVTWANITESKLKDLQIKPWEKYYDYDNISSFLESIRLRYSKNVELVHIGRSYEGRPLVIVKIGFGDTLRKARKSKETDTNSIFIEAGTHGMEWIGPAAAIWIINEILQVMRKQSTTNIEQQLIRNTTWYIMPLLNPDGYVYSHNYDRFWRKTRSRHKTEDGFFDTVMSWLQRKPKNTKFCFGIDLDKNWSNLGRAKSKWNGNACHSFFSGSQDLCEPETRTLSKFIMEHRKNIKLFVSLQAYGEVLKYPDRESASTLNSEAMEDIFNVANQGVNGLRKSGVKTHYRVDFFNDFIEKRSGSSDAFALHKAGIPFAYTLYLADNGVYGFLLPSSLIEKTSRDAFKIIISMLSYIYQL